MDCRSCGSVGLLVIGYSVSSDILGSPLTGCLGDVSRAGYARRRTTAQVLGGGFNLSERRIVLGRWQQSTHGAHLLVYLVVCKGVCKSTATVPFLKQLYCALSSQCR